ncbi:hypothetical protein LOD99_12404 [Oopsacas minuta]|uniref:Uncharacterized protein n=1 Tax=Oopsacas minuta TaxID=111878 RepID=A0AAV7JFK2_9METZ|nr:hypothetical protein LOD99_12404 [Oopsacas minuta]
MEYQKIDTGSESEVSSCEARVTVHQQFSQSELNDLVRDLDLPKQAAELLASTFKEKRVLDRSVKVSIFEKEKNSFYPIFHWKISWYIATIFLVFSDNWVSPHMIQENDDCFWTVPSAASSVFFYTMEMFMKLFQLVTPLS